MSKDSDTATAAADSNTTASTLNGDHEAVTTVSSDGPVDSIVLDEKTALPTAHDGEAPQQLPPPTAPEQGSPEPEADRTKLQTTLIVFALCLALFLAALDITIIATIIPTVSEHFHSSAGYVWVGTSFLLGNAAFIPVWGKISDIFGRKPILLAAVVIFWIGSLLCGISSSMGMLIGARAVQGVGAGGIVVLPNICVSDLFSIRNRSIYFGLFGMVWAIASALGPVLGGVFTSQVSWRWCFYINLPLSAVGFFILLFFLNLHNPRTPLKEGLRAIDWTGSLLIIGGTLMLLFGLEFGGVTFPWSSPTVICLIIFGLVTIVLFGVWEARFAKYPLMPVRMFAHRTSVSSFALAYLHAFVFMSGSYWLPLYFQGVLRASPLLSGVYLLPFVLILSFVSAGVGYVIKKTGNYKIPIMSGLAVTVLGFGLFIDLGARANWAKIIIYQIVAGIGIGPNFQAPLIALQTVVAPRDIGSATSSFGFLRQLGTSSSVVIGGVIFNNEMQRQQPRLQRELGPELADALSGSSAAGNINLVARLDGPDGDIAREAYWNALRTMYIVYTAFAFLALLVSTLIRQVYLTSEHKEHKTGLKTLAGKKAEDQYPAKETSAA
ncbi:major facilitator superfamily-domain-containing protein [Stachybotrys elegans]|uniref:Efflux pump dotC n=1 Tax=Stachybotrys elegans TaxID=80388 RepID=A0A8K0SSW7_9HYPO|nr:major facilitator superfamily-domain-containing protein [Stachybotrys elegans]